MSRHLREVLFFVQQQHEWLVDLQYVLAEKEQRYKILYNKLKYQFKDGPKTKQQQDIFLSYDNDDELSDITNSCHDVDKSSEVDFDIRNNEVSFEVKNEGMSDDENCERELDHRLNDKPINETSNDEKKFNQEEDKVKREILINENCQSEIVREEVQTLKEYVKSEKPSKTSGSDYWKNRYLDKHEMVSSDEKPFSCTYCNKRFARKGNLTQHMPAHTGEKPFSCKICSQKFAYSTSFSRHMMRHTGEKPYKCTICGKKFMLKDHLKSHQRIHSGEKPYKCTYCNKSFAQLASVTRHIRKHTGEKPYECTVCSISFAELGTLKMHTRTQKHKLKATEGSL